MCYQVSSTNWSHLASDHTRFSGVVLVSPLLGNLVLSASRLCVQECCWDKPSWNHLPDLEPFLHHLRETFCYQPDFPAHNFSFGIRLIGIDPSATYNVLVSWHWWLVNKLKYTLLFHHSKFFVHCKLPKVELPHCPRVCFWNHSSHWTHCIHPELTDIHRILLSLAL